MVQMRFLTVSRCREKPDKEKVGAGIESLLLRGCTVRNTDHAVGFVVYTGTFSIFTAASLLSQGARVDSDFFKVGPLCKMEMKVKSVSVLQALVTLFFYSKNTADILQKNVCR